MRSDRLRRLQSLLPVNKLDFLVIVHLPNIRYLTGFTGSAGVLVIGEEKSVFITDGRYREQTRQEVRGVEVMIASKPALLSAAEWLGARSARQRGRRVVGIEATHMAVADRDRLTNALPSKFRIKNAPALVEKERMMKDENELAAIRKAVLAGAALFSGLLENVRPGIKETAIAAEMEYSARKAGCDAMSFETIIASGARSALPHGRASEQPIPRRGFVVCDFGVILAGYCSDMTRTLFVGRPDVEARNFYQSVREAQSAGIAAVRAGVPVSEVDQAARQVLKKAGWGRYFTHSTGHGVGLEIHEAPRIASGQEEILQSGMVITIEPGAYVPRKWGVRIEDMVAVTDHGCEILTPTTKELICI